MILKCKFHSTDFSLFCFHCLFLLILGCQIKDGKKIQAILLYKFKMGHKTAEPIFNISQTSTKNFGQESINE